MTTDLALYAVSMALLIGVMICVYRWVCAVIDCGVGDTLDQQIEKEIDERFKYPNVPLSPEEREELRAAMRRERSSDTPPIAE